MVDESYVPSSGKDVAVKEPENLFLVMENIVDKLKILNYEVGFCKARNVAALRKPLTRTYFAFPHSNPNEQFYYFTSITAWILNQCGANFQAPGQFDDPNASSAAIVEELKKIGYLMDFGPTKLKDGWGETVCSVLDGLLDICLARKNFKFGKPVHIQANRNANDAPPEEYEDEEEIMVADETIVDDEEGEDMLAQEDAIEAESAPIESKVDAAEWQLEVERVSTFLQMPKATEKDWRSHLETIAAHHKIIVEHMTETKTNLDKMNSEIGSTLEKVDTRERFINEKFQHLIEEFKGIQCSLNDTNLKYTDANEKVTELTNQLQTLVDELENVKQKMESHTNNISDTTPLVKLKNAMQKIKEEINQFEVRIGVLENTLLQAKIRSKRTGPMFGHI